MPTLTPQTSGTVAGAGYQNAADFARFSNTVNNPLAGSSATLNIAPTPPTTGPATKQPVVTADAAKKDYAAKLATWQNIQASVKNQQTVIGQQNAQAQADAAKKAADDAQLKIQQAQLADQQQQTANKTAALGVISSPTTTTSGTTGTTGTSPTTAGTDSTITPTPTTSSTDIQSSLNANLNDYTGGLSDIQAQKDQLTAQSQSLLASVMNGTIPLTATQSALISSLQSQLQQNQSSQAVANQAYVGQVTEAAMRAGGEYTPGQTAGAIANAVSYGVAKIQALDNSATQTMATLEDNFQKQNYDEINTNYDTLMKQLDDKSTALTDTYNAVTKALQDQRDALATANKTAFDENLQSEQFSLTQSQDQIDNMFKQGQLTETEYKDRQDLINQRTSDSIAAYNAGLIPGGSFNPATGTFTASNGTQGTSPTTLPGYATLANGSGIVQHPNGESYFVNSDGSLTKFQSGTDAQTFSTNATAANTINKLQVLYNKINTNPTSSDKTQYNSLVDSLPADVQKMIPTVGIFSGSLVSGKNAGNAQFSSAYSTVNSKMSGLIPSYTPPIFGQTFPDITTAMTWAQQSGNAPYIASLHNAGASDAQILAKLNGQPNPGT